VDGPRLTVPDAVTPEGSRSPEKLAVPKISPSTGSRLDPNPRCPLIGTERCYVNETSISEGGTPPGKQRTTTDEYVRIQAVLVGKKP
jgi:hypothetical protein